MLDEFTQIYYDGDNKIKLTSDQTLILSLLIKSKYTGVITYTEFNDYLWHYRNKTITQVKQNLAVAIFRLKKRLNYKINIVNKPYLGYYLQTK